MLNHIKCLIHNFDVCRPKYVSATRRQERGKDPGLGSGSPTRRHLYGYSVLIAGAACYGVGVLSSAWHETPSVTAGLAAGTRRVGAWWGCDAVEDKPELTRCHVVQITRPASGQSVLSTLATHEFTTMGGERERNVLFNDALNTFYLRLYGVRHMVKDHSDSEKGNPLPPHRLLLSINSKGSFICTIPQTG